MSVTKLLKKHSQEVINKPKDRELTKMDKIRASYLEGRKLPKSLQETVDKLERANSLLCGGYSKEQAVKFIVEREKVSKSQAYKIVRESLDLFGDVAKASKEGLRHIVTEGLMQVLNHAKAQKNLEAAERVLTSIARINGLYNSENTGTTMASSINILFTSDPSTLKDDQVPIIDIPHLDL
jgi:hypothetical protein